jgi:hypothetical protein
MEDNENIKNLAAKLREELGIRKSQAAMYAALAKAQGEFKPVAKNRAVQIRMKEGGTYRFEYADLEQLISCTRPALAANGLAVVQRVIDDALSTELVHAEGGTLVSRTELPRMGQDPKSYGAAITYLRRYAYSALLCLAADDDLDEDGQEAGNQGGQEQKAPERRKPEALPKEPRAEQGPSPDNDPAAPAGVKWVKDKLAADQTGKVAEVLERLGIASLDKLTKGQFAKAKEEIMKC